MIFSNLPFPETKQSGSSMSSKSSAFSVSRFEDHSSRSDIGVKRKGKKLRTFSNEVSSNNAKSHFPGQLAEIFRLGNISIYLKPWSSTNLQNWIFFHDRRFLYRFYHCVYSLEAWKKLSDVLEQHDAVITFDIAIFTQGKQIQMTFPKEFSNTVLRFWELRIALNYTCLLWVRSVVFFYVGFRKYFGICCSDIYYTICFNYFREHKLSKYKLSSHESSLSSECSFSWDSSSEGHSLPIRDSSENIAKKIVKCFKYSK